MSLNPQPFASPATCHLTLTCSKTLNPLAQVHPNDVFYECNGAGDCGTPTKYIPGQQWGLNAIGAPAAWKYTTGSRAVKVRLDPES